MMSEYGERECLECGKTFTAIKAWQITCSPECRTKRLMEQKRKCSVLQRAKAKQRMLDLQNLLEKARDYIKFLEQEVERLNKVSSIIDLKYCERMSLKAMQLPCGKRLNCFKPTRCIDCPSTADEKDAFDPSILDNPLPKMRRHK